MDRRRGLRRALARWRHRRSRRQARRDAKANLNKPMADNARASLPSLIVVTGRPGSGKTTLAHALARAVRCPAICRDEIKEGYLNTIGQSGNLTDETARHAYQAFFDTVTLLLHRRITLVAE